MPVHPLNDSFQRTRAHLAAALRCLAVAPGDTLANYHKYLSHNELGLAFEELVYRGYADTDAKAELWRHLDAAAREMGMYTDPSVHARAAARCRERFAESSRQD